MKRALAQESIQTKGIHHKRGQTEQFPINLTLLGEECPSLTRSSESEDKFYGSESGRNRQTSIGEMLTHGMKQQHRRPPQVKIWLVARKQSCVWIKCNGAKPIIVNLFFKANRAGLIFSLYDHGRGRFKLLLYSY